MLLEGFVQEARYNYASTRMYFKVMHDASETTASGDVSIVLMDNDGDAIGSTATMTQLSSGSATYYYDLDTTATSTYSVGENYCMRVDYRISGQPAQRDYVYFDVVLYPLGDPIVSTQEIDAKHPDWKRAHPSGSSGTWTVAIEHAHVDIARRLRASGNRARQIVVREELWPYELAFAEAECAERLMMMPPDERKYWRDRAEKKWSSRGEFQLDSDSDPEIDDGAHPIGQPVFSR